ncbi:hypothetical protein ACFWP3_23615 [Streptomyces sp. NPDC058525]|uniref:hypothetical protein n=1 Tax=Streptomyces sp. NPDC058525 TaxID=3346538 RepID=UPI0036536EDE
MTDDVRDPLREAARNHRPDRARMLARVERGMAAPSPAPRRARTPRAWPRVALAAVAAAGAMTAATVVVAAVSTGPGPAPAPPAAVSHSPAAPPTDPGTAAAADGSPSEPATTPAPGRSGAALSVPSPTAPSGPSASASTGAVGTPTPSRRTEDGPLWSDGSVDPHSISSWSQSNVTLKTREPLTALTVELRIGLTPGVKDTGHWQTRPADDFTVTVRQEGGFLVYRWVLRPGRTIPSGEQVFAGQYNHADGGRDARADVFRAEAAMASGKASVWGDFAPVR